MHEGEGHALNCSMAARSTKKHKDEGCACVHTINIYQVQHVFRNICSGLFMVKLIRIVHLNCNCSRMHEGAQQ